MDGDNAKWEIVPDGKNPKVIPSQLSKSRRRSITSENLDYNEKVKSVSRAVNLFSGDDITKITLFPLLPRISRIKMEV